MKKKKKKITLFVDTLTTTKANGKVKNKEMPRKTLAILITISSLGKLFKIFPWVDSPKEQYPTIPNVTDKIVAMVTPILEAFAVNWKKRML